MNLKRWDIVYIISFHTAAFALNMFFYESFLRYVVTACFIAFNTYFIYDSVSDGVSLTVALIYSFIELGSLVVVMYILPSFEELMLYLMPLLYLIIPLSGLGYITQISLVIAKILIMLVPIVWIILCLYNMWRRVTGRYIEVARED